MLSRPFVALFISVFVATLGISMVSPLLPVYAEKLGASGVELGLAFSSFAIVQAVFGPITGRLSDRYPRKPFIVAGLCIYLIAALGYLTAGSVFQVIAFRAFSGLGTSMIFSVARAYVGDLTPRGHEGRWLGVFALADLLGFGTGPLIAGVIRDAVGFDAVFITMASLMGLAALIVAFWLPRQPPIRETSRRTAGRPANASFRDALRDRLVLALTVHATLVSLSSGMIFPFLSLRLERDIGASPTLVGLAFALQDVSAGLAQFAFGRVADRRDRRTLVGIGLFTLAALQMTLGLTGTYAVAGVILFAMGASSALAQVAGGAIQVVSGRRAGMGTVLGLTSSGNAVGLFTGSLVGGYIQGPYGLPASFIIGGAGVAVGTVVFLVLTRGLRTSEPVEVTRGIEPGEAAAARA
jgi:MFS family permease